LLITLHTHPKSLGLRGDEGSVFPFELVAPVGSFRFNLFFDMIDMNAQEIYLMTN